ncbi:FlhC family transcriptional regulator, partial [Erwinia amylovora]|uniref:FlhC family transcriptional regulator n=1 Tax=Erwinia amylovora TaxID=552 RepID=UPI00295EF5DB
EKPVLGLTRAGTLLRCVGCGISSQKSCAVGKGGFVVATEVIKNPFTCSLCSPPSRALKNTQVNNHEYVSSYPQQLTASA